MSLDRREAQKWREEKGDTMQQERVGRRRKRAAFYLVTQPSVHRAVDQKVVGPPQTLVFHHLTLSISRVPLPSLVHSF
eukprot:767137-Hanusia_phi.AAC.28